MKVRPTTRLYYDDSLRCEFESKVIHLGSLQGRPTAVLEQSAFYPESGGQMSDHGTLGGLAVSDVQVDEDGVVHHVIGQQKLEVGQKVTGKIDLQRRRIHMAQHTGQHMLSRALENIADASTVSARLGETACTIDIDMPHLPEELVLRVEALVNRWIEEDHPIHKLYPSPDELARMELRKSPTVNENIRIIHIDGIDHTPCGGTHCNTTAQVGVVHINRIERQNNLCRLSFVAGRRAKRLLFRQSRMLRNIGRELTCNPDDVSGLYTGLKRDLQDVRSRLGRTESLLADHLVAAFSIQEDEDSHQPLVADLGPVSASVLRDVAARLSKSTQQLVIVATQTPGGLHAIAQRPEEGGFNCSQLIQALGEKLGGRGGGRPHRAEGKFQEFDWTPSVMHCLQEILHGLQPTN